MTNTAMRRHKKTRSLRLAVAALVTFGVATAVSRYHEAHPTRPVNRIFDSPRPTDNLPPLESLASLTAFPDSLRQNPNARRVLLWQDSRRALGIEQNDFPPVDVRAAAVAQVAVPLDVRPKQISAGRPLKWPFAAVPVSSSPFNYFPWGPVAQLSPDGKHLLLRLQKPGSHSKGYGDPTDWIGLWNLHTGAGEVTSRLWPARRPLTLPKGVKTEDGTVENRDAVSAVFWMPDNRHFVTVTRAHGMHVCDALKPVLSRMLDLTALTRVRHPLDPVPLGVNRRGELVWVDRPSSLGQGGVRVIRCPLVPRDGKLPPPVTMPLPQIQDALTYTPLCLSPEGRLAGLITTYAPPTETTHRQVADSPFSNKSLRLSLVVSDLNTGKTRLLASADDDQFASLDSTSEGMPVSWLPGAKEISVTGERGVYRLPVAP